MEEKEYENILKQNWANYDRLYKIGELVELYEGDKKTPVRICAVGTYMMPVLCMDPNHGTSIINEFLEHWSNAINCSKEEVKGVPFYIVVGQGEDERIIHCCHYNLKRI